MGHSAAAGFQTLLYHVGTYDWWFVKNKQRRLQVFLLGAVMGLLFLFSVFTSLHRNSSGCRQRKTCPCDLIVPDIIHFYRSDNEANNISKKDAACMRAALRLHGEVWLHTTSPENSRRALDKVGIELNGVRVMYPPRGPGPIHLAILREYGGIFLKNDIYMVSRLDAMRGHELCSVGRDDIVAGTRDGALGGFGVKLRGILLDKDYGALYITDIMRNCTYSAVRLEVR